MNLSAAIMLVDKNVRSVRVEYDPEVKYNNNPNKVFKTINKGIKTGDLVVVQTNTRHGFTICKVTEIDFPVDFNSSEQWGWIGDKFDKDMFDAVLKIEDGVKVRVAKAEENRMREQLKRDMGLSEVDFSDLDIAKLGAPTAAATFKEVSEDPLA